MANADRSVQQNYPPPRRALVRFKIGCHPNQITMFDYHSVAWYCPGNHYVHSSFEMEKRRSTRSPKPRLREVPDQGTRISAVKNQGYQLPLHLWQDLVDEVTRRKKLGLPFASQNAIAVAGITEWLEKNKEAQ